MQQAVLHKGPAAAPAGGNKEALAFFRTLNRANTYAIAYRLQTAKKPGTRARRMERLLAMLARQEKLHP